MTRVSERGGAGPYGTGPGEMAPGGSAVEHYAALPPDRPSTALVHETVGPRPSFTSHRL